jgi:hypothetical protein
MSSKSCGTRYHNFFPSNAVAVGPFLEVTDLFGDPRWCLGTTAPSFGYPQTGSLQRAAIRLVSLIEPAS